MFHHNTTSIAFQAFHRHSFLLWPLPPPPLPPSPPPLPRRSSQRRRVLPCRADLFAIVLSDGGSSERRRVLLIALPFTPSAICHLPFDIGYRRLAIGYHPRTARL